MFKHEFFSRFFSQKGIADGVTGTALSLLQSFYELTTRLKIWQSSDFIAKPESESESIKALTEFKNDLQYWLADWHVHNTTGVSQMFWKLRRKLKI